MNVVDVHKAPQVDMALMWESQRDVLNDSEGDWRPDGKTGMPVAKTARVCIRRARHG
jgi:hypothetical protein